jgi:thiamine-monophosphate kinase
MQRPSEDELIATYFAPLAGTGAFGLRDDAALLSEKLGHDVVVTTDMLVAGVHFFPSDPPGAVARKALRVNLSDLAAKTAEPLGFLLGLALPEDWTEAWLAGFSQGLGEDAAAFNCPLLGGDTVKTFGATTISITAFGAVPAGSMIMRGAIVAGDRIYVSGTIGDASLGLKFRLNATEDLAWRGGLNAEEAAYLVGRYLLPQPHLALRNALRAHAHAAMDISDGFAGDLTKMLRLSGMTAKVLVADVPLSAPARTALRTAPSLAETILTGGDDYEILCAVPRSRCASFEAEAGAAGVLITPVAKAVAGKDPPNFKDNEGNSLAFARRSFQHF